MRGRKPVFRKASGPVLGDHPRLKRRKEQRRGDAAEHPPQEQQVQGGEVLEGVDDHFKHAKEDAAHAAAVPVDVQAHPSA